MVTKTDTKTISKKIESNITIQPVSQASVTLRIIGTTPMYQNRMSAKVKNILLTGARKKTTAERAGIKHSPFEEFRDSIEMMLDGPTAIGQRVIGIKAAMCTAALETEGVKKTSAQRLLFVEGDLTPLYGIPKIRLDVVRSADIARTPDIRSRAYFEKWGCEIVVKFVSPQLSVRDVVTLLANAGILVGLGDYRQEKGKGSFGAFRVITPGMDDPEWDDLVQNCGREAQLEAIANPEPANHETQELIEFYESELKKRA